MPDELERIIYKTLEKDYDLRYQTASEIKTDLKRLKRDREIGKPVSRLRPAKLGSGSSPVGDSSARRNPLRCCISRT